MKQIRFIVRILISILISLVFLLGISYLLFNKPFHIKSQNPSVDYTIKSNSKFSDTSEGYFHGKANNEGFFNAKDYTKGDVIDVLLMGTSNIRGNVAIEDTIGTMLNTMLPEKNIYNIGVADCFFFNQVHHLVPALYLYSPKFVVLEYNPDVVKNEHLKSLEMGIAHWSRQQKQKDSLFRPLSNILRNNLRNIFNIIDKQETLFSQPIEQNKVNKLLSKVKLSTNKYKANCILIYHPTTKLSEDGSLILGGTQEERNIISEGCKNNGIVFLDLSGRFETEYLQNYILPHGFKNTKIGIGHLNREGNRIVAEELAKIIQELESNK